MTNVLYEISPDFSYRFLIIPSIIALLLLFYFPFCIKHRFERKNMELTTRIKLFYAGAILFGILSDMAITAGYYALIRAEYDRTVVPYYNGEYEMVEGFVENFDSKSDVDGNREGFEIGGVKFFYQDDPFQIGYHTTKDNNGVITGDGQHLRIRYIYLGKNYGNIILYIEELPD